MAETRSKAQLVAAVRRVRADMEALLASIAPARLVSEPVAGEWTAKDVVAHLTAWRWWSVARLEAARHGHPPRSLWPAFPHPDDAVDAFNAMVTAASRDRSLDDVLAESRLTFDRLEAALEALPDDVLFHVGRFSWLGNDPLAAVIDGMVEHWAVDHAPDLRKLVDGG